VKCDQVFPCKRCKRLGSACIPHQSRQGQNSGKTKSHKRARVADKKMERNDDIISLPTTTTADWKEPKNEDDAISSKMIQDPSVTNNHFWLHYLVRSWVALALKRRSFALLGRAANMAVQCGISMDDVLCEMNERRGMDFLYPFLLTPFEEQKLVGSELKVSEVPMSLWRSIGIQEEAKTYAKVEETMRDRWIYVRETKNGVPSFYCSPAFERHVVTRTLIEETYKSNKQHISKLFLADSENKKKVDNILAFAHQVSLHCKPGIVTQPTRQSNVRLKVKTSDVDGEEVIAVDQIWGLAIFSVDHSIGLIEFIDKRAKMEQNGRDTCESDVEQFQSLFDDVDAIDSDDDEFRFIHDLLSN
jgi:hypothetical protein